MALTVNVMNGKLFAIKPKNNKFTSENTYPHDKGRYFNYFFVVSSGLDVTQIKWSPSWRPLLIKWSPGMAKWSPGIYWH